MAEQARFSHFDEAGNARMVDVGAKGETVRRAVEEEADHGDYAYAAVYLLRHVGLFDRDAAEGLADG